MSLEILEKYQASFPKAGKSFYTLCKDQDIALTFQDVLLEPQYSEIQSRSNVCLKTWITPLRTLNIPIIAANMDTVCESEMAIAMGQLGGMGVIHRYMDYEKQVKEVAKTALTLHDTYSMPIAAAIGVKNGVVEQAIKLVAAGADIIVIDVAHGHHKTVIELLTTLKTLDLTAQDVDQTPVEFIVGNVASYDGVYTLFINGADAVKVGVGAGSICSTRTVTGHGMPQLLAIATASLAATSFNRPIIADGGFKNSGDIVKALAVGANTIMTGYLLAGTDETPTKYRVDEMKAYRGMASNAAQKEFYGNDPEAPEGVSVLLAEKGPVEGVLKQLVAGVKSGLSYSGASNLEELRTKGSFVHISNNAYLESLTLND